MAIIVCFLGLQITNPNQNRRISDDMQTGISSSSGRCHRPCDNHAVSAAAAQRVDKMVRLAVCTLMELAEIRVAV